MIINGLSLNDCWKDGESYPSLCSYPRSGGTHFLGLLRLMCPNIPEGKRFFASHYLYDFNAHTELDKSFYLIRHPIYCAVSLWEFEQAKGVQYPVDQFVEDKMYEWIGHFDKAAHMSKWGAVVFYHDLIFRKLETVQLALIKNGFDSHDPENPPQEVLDYCEVNAHTNFPYQERNLFDFHHYNRKRFAKYWNLANDWFKRRHINIVGV